MVGYEDGCIEIATQLLKYKDKDSINEKIFGINNSGFMLACEKDSSAYRSRMIKTRIYRSH
jgi:hypothetical protein